MTALPPFDPFPSSVECLDEDTLAQLAEGLVSGARRERAERHLAACDSCRAIVVASAQAHQATMPAGGPDAGRLLPMRRSAIAFAAAASVLAAIGVAWLATSRSPDAPTTEARLVAGARSLASADAALFAEFRPYDRAELAGIEPDAQRGGLDWMSPKGTTLDVRPTFRWSEVDGATEYRVSILGEDGTRLLSTKVREARFEGTELETPLVRGAGYVWKVTAVGAPTPAEGSTALRVASEADARLRTAIVSRIAAALDDDIEDLVTAHALLRRGWPSEALPFALRYSGRSPADALGTATLAFVRRSLAPARNAR